MKTQTQKTLKVKALQSEMGEDFPVSINDATMKTQTQKTQKAKVLQSEMGEDFPVSKNDATMVTQTQKTMKTKANIGLLEDNKLGSKKTSSITDNVDSDTERAFERQSTS